ncbi:hypothetical protein JCM10207_006521 [Rhodosporidiobolus poonsookiae]
MKNVLVVGYGPAGATVVNNLAAQLPLSHRLVVVSAAEPYWCIAGLRGAVIPGWEEKIVAPSAKCKLFQAGSRHVLLEGTCVVKLNLNNVVVSKAHPDLKLDEEIPFEYCILATGSNHSFPSKASPGATYAETLASLLALQSDLASSSSILIAGGGPVGIEYAGEIASRFTGTERKKITLVHSRKRLMDEDGYTDKFRRSLTSQLEANGVEIVLGARTERGLTTGKVEGGERAFALDNGKVVKADFVFVAYGNTPATSFIGAFDPDLLNDKHGVRVKPTLQLVSEEARYDHIFAVGDITDFDEMKAVSTGMTHAGVASANLLALLAAKPLPKTHTAGRKYQIGITIGRFGAGQMMGWLFGPWLMWLMKSRSLGVGYFPKMYQLA